MTKRWAVSHINWFDHNLTTVIVHAGTWVEALQMHPKIAEIEFEHCDNLEQCKTQAFDCDAMVECVEIV